MVFSNQVWIFSVCINISSLLLLPIREVCLQGQQFLFLPCFNFSVLHFLWVGQTSLLQRILMLLVFLSALAFTGPETRIFNFVPCKLIMISKHDFTKAAMGFCS